MDSLTLKRHNSFQNENNRKAKHNFVPDLWFLSCNKKFKNSSFSWGGAPQKLTWKQTFYTYKIGVSSTSLFLNCNPKVNIWHYLLNNLFVFFLNLFISLTELKNIH